MKTMKVKEMQNLLNCVDRVKTCIETVDGFETANFDPATGRITYTKGCGDEKLLKEALAREGIETEEVKD